MAPEKIYYHGLGKLKVVEKLIDKGLTDPELLSEVTEIEHIVRSVGPSNYRSVSEPDRLMINPTVQPYEATWKGLSSLFRSKEVDSTPLTKKEHELLLIWWDFNTASPRVEPASDRDLLVLKMIEERMDPVELASRGNIPIGAVQGAIDHAAAKGLILRPKTKIRRDPGKFCAPTGIDEEVLAADVFTLQWHVTQQCDLHCKHCYDRSNRSPLTLEQGYAVLKQLWDFCRQKHVSGQISFSGGNPLLYPHFIALYKRAVEYGFVVAILGNPTSRDQVQEIIEIQPPDFYQVSLEGLPDHNDSIRGKGHFDRTMAFLELLKEMEIYSMVMLTLTRDNMNQILPLAEILKDKVDLFTFNRLSMVGEGANLQLPPPSEYRAFLLEYIAQLNSNPVLALKDNLFNIALDQQGKRLFGGCTGYGCGAAFNFLALLPDGEVHACRKFPSLLGNIHEKSLIEIYDSELAKRYRKGPEPCGDCDIKAVCRGCLAIAHSFGLDIFAQKDPFCYI